MDKIIHSGLALGETRLIGSHPRASLPIVATVVAVARDSAEAHRSLPLTTMSYEKKFNAAVEIVQNLPKDGPVKPSQDDQLFVSTLNQSFALLK